MEAILRNTSRHRTTLVSQQLDRPVTPSQPAIRGQPQPRLTTPPPRTRKPRAASTHHLKPTVQASRQLITMAYPTISSRHPPRQITSLRLLRLLSLRQQRKAAWTSSTRKTYGALQCLAIATVSLQQETHLVDSRVARLARIVQASMTRGIRSSNLAQNLSYSGRYDGLLMIIIPYVTMYLCRRCP